MNIFKLVGTVFVDTDAANQSLQKTDKSAENTGKGFSDLAKKVGSGAAKIGKAAAGMAVAAGTALVAMTNESREYRNEIAKLVTAFGDQEFSAKTAKKTYKELQGVVGDTEQAVEASNHLAELCDNEKQLSDWTTICTGVYAKFGASLPIEGLTEAANETAKVGQVTGPLAGALNWIGISEDKFNESLAKCNSEQERAALITETLKGKYSGLAADFKKNNKEVIDANKAQERLNASMAAIGTVVEPLITTVKSVGASFIEDVTPAVEKFCGYVSENLPKVINWFEKHKAVILTLATAIGVLKAGALLYKAVQAVKIAMNAAETASLAPLIAAQLASAAATWAAMAPIIAIVAAIAAVIAIIVLCVKHWDKIKEAVGNAMEFIVEKVQSGVEKVKGFFEKIINFVKTNWAGLLLLLVNPIAGGFKLLYDNCEGFRNFVNNFIAKIKNDFKNGFNAVKQAIITPIKNAISNVKSRLESLRDFVKNIIAKIKGFFNFTFSIPKIKLPHFTIKPKGWQLDDLLKGSIPKLDIDWYAKAMDKGMILNEPTIFGMNAAGQFMGGGEVGSETVVGTQSLMDMINGAVGSQNKMVVYYLQKMVEIMTDYFPQVISGMDRPVCYDPDAMAGSMAVPMDKYLGMLKARKDRGR